MLGLSKVEAIDAFKVIVEGSQLRQVLFYSYKDSIQGLKAIYLQQHLVVKRIVNEAVISL